MGGTGQFRGWEGNMSNGILRVVAFGALGLTVCGTAGDAFAEESIFPYLPGATLGIPAGALPPPGFYVDEKFFVFNYVLHNGSGNVAFPTVKIREVNEDTTLLWVPGWKVLGADYGAFFVQPYRSATTSVTGLGAGDSRTFAGDMINPVLSPVNLSWNLGEGWHVSTGFTYYPGAYSWKTGTPNILPITNAINAGRNYDTFESSFAASYLAGGWNLTLHALIDFNDTNTANNYHSGTTFLMDYTATRKFGEFDFGVVGTVIQQLENDTQNGAVVTTATPGVLGYGNKASSFSIGPSIGYEWNKVHFSMQWTDWVYAKNTAGGNQTWFRVHVPVSSATAALEPPLK
jgi:hypothetical protein